MSLATNPGRSPKAVRAARGPGKHCSHLDRQTQGLCATGLGLGSLRFHSRGRGRVEGHRPTEIFVPVVTIQPPYKQEKDVHHWMKLVYQDVCMSSSYGFGQPGSLWGYNVCFLLLPWLLLNGWIIIVNEHIQLWHIHLIMFTESLKIGNYRLTVNVENWESSTWDVIVNTIIVKTKDLLRNGYICCFFFYIEK